MKKEYIAIALGDLVPYKNNPRKNDEAVSDVEESINQIGYIAPIIIDENNVILAGHTRLKSLLSKNGGVMTEKVDVIKVSGLTEEQKKKYRLLDNKTGEKAEWDSEKLWKELEDLDFGEFDFSFGFDENDRNVQTEIHGMHGIQPQQPAEQMPGPRFTPDGVFTEDDDGSEDPYLPEPYNKDEIQEYIDRQEEYTVKKRIIITYLPEREQDLMNLLQLKSIDKIVYDIADIIGA